MWRLMSDRGLFCLSLVSKDYLCLDQQDLHSYSKHILFSQIANDDFRARHRFVQSPFEPFRGTQSQQQASNQTKLIDGGDNHKLEPICPDVNTCNLCNLESLLVTTLKTHVYKGVHIRRSEDAQMG